MFSVILPLLLLLFLEGSVLNTPISESSRNWFLVNPLEKYQSSFVFLEKKFKAKFLFVGGRAKEAFCSKMLRSVYQKD